MADASLLQRLQEDKLYLVEVVARLAHETRPPTLHVRYVVQRNVTAKVQVATMVALGEEGINDWRNVAFALSSLVSKWSVFYKPFSTSYFYPQPPISITQSLR